ncbi:hypothetical protein BH10PAT1_BH10PAT1_3580 [soil metagenome]
MKVIFIILIVIFLFPFANSKKILAVSYSITQTPISLPQVAFGGVKAGNFDSAKLKNWNEYFYPYLLKGEGTGLSNVYSTEILKNESDYYLFYGGWNTNDPVQTSDRIFVAKSNNFLNRLPTDFSQTNWTNRQLIMDANKAVANDPTIVNYGGNNFLMLYSTSEAPINGVQSVNKIQYSVSSNLTDWFLNHPDPSKYIEVKNGNALMNFTIRPSLVFSNNTYYLYFDEGGNPSATENGGFTIEVATSSDGIHFNYIGKTLAPGSEANGNGSSGEVEKFNSNWVMFYDRGINDISFATSINGLNFIDKGKTYTSPTKSITNTNIIREDDKFLGLIYGQFPTLSEYETNGKICQYPYSTQFCLEDGVVNVIYLQKKIVFEGNDGRIFNAAWSIDDDKLFLKTNLQINEQLAGKLKVYDTDGTTLLFESALTMKPGILYQINEFEGKAADANNDQHVDGIDYVIWLRNYQKNNISGPIFGDFNNDAKVNEADYSIWKANYL